MLHNRELRVILHIDLDCFYVQVERYLNKDLFNQCVGVVQYNPLGDVKTVGPRDNRVLTSSSGYGGLIAVSYEARARGVNRHMRAAEAKSQCPELILVQVPVTRGKPDLSAYRQAGDRVVGIIQKHVCGCPIERASIDEVYVDISSMCHQRLNANSDRNFDMHTWEDMRVAGVSDNEIATQWLAAQNNAFDEDASLLNVGALIAREVRQLIFQELHFTCSAGIAHNKLLAKIASSMHKPNIQTLVPPCFLPQLLGSLPLRKLRGLGGKLGDILTEEMGLQMACDIEAVGLDTLASRFGQQQAEYLIQLSRGESSEEVTHRLAPSNITCSKQFNGRAALPLEASLKRGDIDKWLQRLTEEMLERVGDGGAQWLCTAIHLTTLNNNRVSDETEKIRLSKRIEFPTINSSVDAPMLVSQAAIRLVKEALANPSHRARYHQFVGDAALLAEYRNKQSTLLPPHNTSCAVWYVSSISVQAQRVGSDEEKDSRSDAADIRNFFGAPAATVSDSNKSIIECTGLREGSSESSSGPSGNKAPEGVDAAVFAALPPEIQKEITIEAENKRIFEKFRNSTTTSTAQRKKPRGIDSYFK